MIPLPALFAKPERSSLRISPLERWLAWTARDENGRLNIWVQQRQPPKEPKKVTFREDRDACIFFTFTMDDKTVLYLSDPSHGSETYHLFAVDLDDERHESRDLIRDPKLTVVVGFFGPFQLWRPRETPREVYAATGRGSTFWDISRLNVDTCEMEVVASNPMASWLGIARFAICTLLATALRCCSCGCLVIPSPRAALFWFPDRQSRFRGRIDVSLEGLSLFVHMSVLKSKGRWLSFDKVNFTDLNMQLPGSTGGAGLFCMDFSDDGTSIVVHTGTGRDTTALTRYDTTTGATEVLATSKTSDITGFLRHPTTGIVEAVQYDGEKPSWQVLDQSVASDLALLQERFPGLDVTVMPRPVRDQTWVLHVSGDTEPGVYYLYERPEQKITEVCRPYPKLAEYRLGTMHPIWVTARDGHRVLCYLSLPPGETPGKREQPLPMVLYIHGGPNARDFWGFNSVCQLLTSRGMAVLQVNYRGSTGLGSRWVQLGMEGAFSREMQYDIEDAARWAVKENIADPARLAMLGASFGGYATLFHLTMGSLKLRAGVAICALSSVGKASSLSFRGDPLIAQYWKRVFGQAAHDLEVAKKASPAHYMDRLKSPLLLLHGENDPRVPQAHSDALADDVQKGGYGGAYVTYADEGHSIRKEANVLDMWSRVEQFLCKELQLPVGPATAAEGSSATTHFLSVQ